MNNLKIIVIIRKGFLCFKFHSTESKNMLINSYYISQSNCLFYLYLFCTTPGNKTLIYSLIIQLLSKQVNTTVTLTEIMRTYFQLSRRQTTRFINQLLTIKVLLRVPCQNFLIGYSGW